jgi:hypothetical protein
VDMVFLKFQNSTLVRQFASARVVTHCSTLLRPFVSALVKIDSNFFKVWMPMSERSSLNDSDALAFMERILLSFFSRQKLHRQFAWLALSKSRFTAPE